MQNQPPRDHSWAVEGWEVEMKPMAMSEDIYMPRRGHRPTILLGKGFAQRHAAWFRDSEAEETIEGSNQLPHAVHGKKN